MNLFCLSSVITRFFSIVFRKELTMTIKDRIRGLCREKGMSLPLLEAALGFGNGTITKWDKSAPSTDKLSRVADYFNVSVDYLLGRVASRNMIDPDSIDGIYLSYAKDMQNNGIDPDDVKLVIETVLKLRGRE